MDFLLSWKSPYADHREMYHLEKVDFWRDIFPGHLAEKAEHLSPGESCEEAFGAGTLVPPYSEKNIIEFDSSFFTPENSGTTPFPAAGRIYPKGCAWKPLNSFPEDRTPFRIANLTNGRIVADTNHPLARYPLTLHLTMGNALQSGPQRGGSLNDVVETIANSGAGLQVSPAEHTRKVYDHYPFSRENEGDDGDFYRQPRMVHHLDSTARGHVESLYGRILQPGMRVLDFMGSWDSHLPDSLTGCTVEGIGLNEQELQSNSRLTAYRIQDLNTNTRLPFTSDSFDAVICTVSIEYLIRPREIIDELHRILKPQGPLVVTFSDRWFPGKEISPWKDLHPFERQGLILRYFLYHGGFDNLFTESIQGWPRPADDKYSRITPWSDPVFTVCGRVDK